jgi:hypothetical protein
MERVKGIEPSYVAMWFLVVSSIGLSDHLKTGHA